tara:strand:- start:4775 stop:5137 length:363 start_codon:yes stop_codon:yes gene_type:complete
MLKDSLTTQLSIIDTSGTLGEQMDIPSMHQSGIKTSFGTLGYGITLFIITVLSVWDGLIVGTTEDGLLINGAILMVGITIMDGTAGITTTTIGITELIIIIEGVLLILMEEEALLLIPAL